MSEPIVPARGWALVRLERGAPPEDHGSWGFSIPLPPVRAELVAGFVRSAYVQDPVSHAESLAPQPATVFVEPGAGFEVGDGLRLVRCADIGGWVDPTPSGG